MSAIEDDPKLDGTDFAHPAYWRGHDQATAQVCQLLKEIMDGKPVTGMSQEPWETTRRRLGAIVQEWKQLREVHWDKFGE